MGHAGRETSLDGGDEVLHLGEPFQPGEIRDPDAAELANAAEIVPQQVGDHDEFGILLLAALQLPRELGIPHGVGMPGARAP